MIFTITLRNESGKNKLRDENEGKDNRGAVNSKPANKAEVLMMNNGTANSINNFKAALPP